jgi:isoquinoline 1-oxidoreductase beta subunit
MTTYDLNRSTPLPTSRRKFLVTSMSAGAGLVLGFALPSKVFSATATQVTPEINAWVVVKPDDTVVIRIARTEMGQGTLTGLAQLVAEELDCDWNKVITELVAPQDNLARQNVWGQMLTVGSFGIRFSQDLVRRGGAAAKMMLMQAAANQWQVPVGELMAKQSVIRHTPSGRTTSYGAVADAAAKLVPPDPKTMILKDPKQWTLIGQPLKRLDTLDKLDGSKKYAVDVQLPGMLNAIYFASPVFGAKLKSLDDRQAINMPGVKKVLKVADDGYAVVADTWWQAKVAAEKVLVVWDDAELSLKSSSTIDAYLKTGLTATSGLFTFRDEGTALTQLAKDTKKIEATYSAPFLAHATMEPMNCTALVTPDRAEIWVGTQDPEGGQLAMSKTLALPMNQCFVNRFDPGGGFGRRGRVSDYVVHAVNIAKQIPGVPIKMLWTREEDMAHGQYRPISMCKLSASLDENNRLHALHIRLSGQSIYAWRNPTQDLTGFKDNSQVQGWSGDPKSDQQLCYGAPHLKIEYAMRNTHVPVGTWRGVNVPQNSFYVEAFIDELARYAKKDPLEFRRENTKLPKQLAILNLAAEKGNWGKSLPPGVHRGIAQFMSYDTYSAATVELSVKPSGEVKVHRVVLALDCGYAVNPSQIEAQVQGSIVYGLSAAMWGECTVQNGRIKQRNFDDYRVLRLAEMPKVETYIQNTGDRWGGVGEPLIAAITPAVINALAVATGKRIRDLPIKNHSLKT